MIAPTRWWLPLASLLVAKAAPAAEPPGSGGLVSVAMRKQHVPVIRANRTVSQKTAYFGRVFVGHPSPQEFTVVFDTGSGHFILPSSLCDSDACLLRRRYERGASASAVDIELDGTPVASGAEERDQVAIAFGTGEVTGEFAEEVVCLSNASTTSLAARADCVRFRVVLATEMTTEPFSLFHFDGVLGLGLDALTLSPEFSFFGAMTRANPRMEPIFSVFLAEGDVASEISFGGHNPHRLHPGAELAWAKVVHPELGYWQVTVTSIFVGDEKLDICDDGTCRAILDTGTSLLGVPQEVAQSMHWKLARVVEDYRPELDCRNFPGPDLLFHLGSFAIRLGSEDYSRPAAARMRPPGAEDRTEVFCRPTLLPVDMAEPLGSKVFIFGEPVLRKYYTAYDWKKQQIGFGLARPLAAAHAASHEDTMHSV